MLRWLRALDDKALNAWWGALLVPFPWLAYRLGRRTGGDGESVWAYLLLGPVGGLVYNRGRAEGRPLPERRRPERP